LDQQVEAVMSSSRVLLAVIAASVAMVEDSITLPQWRILVLIFTRGSQSIGQVADELGVHASNATRACDRLVTVGLVDRRDAPEDRRRCSLTLTPAGRQLVTAVLDHRRTAITAVLKRMPRAERAALAPALEAFAHAAGEPSHQNRLLNLL
jgi:DNA-binding MarR family transcriptional regulator